MIQDVLKTTLRTEANAFCNGETLAEACRKTGRPVTGEVCDGPAAVAFNGRGGNADVATRGAPTAG